MKNLLPIILSAFLLYGCSVLKPDYSHYVIGVPTNPVSVVDWTDNAEQSSLIYAASTIKGKMNYITLIQSAGQPTNHSTADGKVKYTEALKMLAGKDEKMGGHQAVKVASGKVNLKFSWIAFNTGVVGGYQSYFPQTLSFQAEANQKYLLTTDNWSNSKSFYIREMETGRRVPVTFTP